MGRRWQRQKCIDRNDGSRNVRLSSFMVIPGLMTTATQAGALKRVPWLPITLATGKGTHFSLRAGGCCSNETPECRLVPAQAHMRHANDLLTAALPRKPTSGPTAVAAGARPAPVRAQGPPAH